MKYLVVIEEPGNAEWYEVEAPTAEEGIRAVHNRIRGGEPLGADTTITAVIMPEKPICITRLADMTEFEAEFRQTP